VQGAVVRAGEFPQEVNGFGTLSFLKKVDVAAPVDGVLGALYRREGDRVLRGEELAALENPQIRLAVGRAEQALAQAEAETELARARLLEAEFQSEARLLGIEKAEAELEEARRSYGEQDRKQRDQEILFRAGGVSEEMFRTGRFSLGSAEAQLGLMERELEIRRIGSRDRDLLAGGIPPPAEQAEGLAARIRLATAVPRAELRSAEARLEAAAKELESARVLEAGLRLTSPAAGIVAARYAEEGERIKGEDKILTLINTESLYAVFSVREADAFKLKKGMAARVTLDGAAGSYEGTVDLVAPQADAQSFTFPVRVLLPPEALVPAGDGEGAEGAEGNLRPGMFARVSVSLGPPRTAALVPESSLMNRRNGEALVFTVKGNTLTERRITLGESLGADWEISSGLVPGEVVVLRPDSGLRDGLYVALAD
jgi:RND family efflux transporter MFP subunit